MCSFFQPELMSEKGEREQTTAPRDTTNAGHILFSLGCHLCMEQSLEAGQLWSWGWIWTLYWGSCDLVMDKVQYFLEATQGEAQLRDAASQEGRCMEASWLYFLVSRRMEAIVGCLRLLCLYGNALLCVTDKLLAWFLCKVLYGCNLFSQTQCMLHYQITQLWLCIIIMDDR